jgi:hypothetical protein
VPNTDNEMGRRIGGISKFRRQEMEFKESGPKVVNKSERRDIVAVENEKE